MGDRLIFKNILPGQLRVILTALLLTIACAVGEIGGPGGPGNGYTPTDIGGLPAVVLEEHPRTVELAREFGYDLEDAGG